jgi:ligand-binding sensor domain-containing protein
LVRTADEGLLAGTFGGGLFRSADGGELWEVVNRGLSDLGVRALVSGPDGDSLLVGTRVGVYRSDNGGSHWRAANRGLTDLDIQALVIGPGGRSLFAGTFTGGVFRSDDGGEHWWAVNQGLSDLDVRALVVGPDGQSLFAGTGSGMFRSDDGGASWRAVNRGLTIRAIRRLALGSDKHNLFAGTLNGVFRSVDGESWQAVEGLTLADLPANVSVGGTHLVSSEGRINLARPGMDWFSWGTYRHQAPRAGAIQGNRITLYTSAGAAMLLRAEDQPLPLIWSAPTPYLALVTATWRGINWAGEKIARSSFS